MFYYKFIWGLLLLFLLHLQINMTQQKVNDYTLIEYSTEIINDKELDVKQLFKGDSRIISHIQMNNGKSLGNHSVSMPIVILCASGNGELVFDENNIVKLEPGSMITIEANVTHDVIAKPDLSILVIRLLNDRDMD